MSNQSPANLNTSKRANRLLVLILVGSMLLTYLVLSPYLWDRYRVVKDAQNFYWMARYQDPTLFATDYLFGRRLIEVDILGLHLILYPHSLGYGLFFSLASFIIDYIWLSKWLIFILIPVCIVYLFKLGQLLKDNLAAASLSLLFVFMILASYQSISPASGLQRAFAVPLLIVFLYYMIREQYMGAGLTIVLSALFYLPNFALTVVVYGLSFIKLEPRFKVSLNLTRAKLLPFVGSLLISMLVVALFLAVELTQLLPQDISITQNPNFQAKGATPMFISFPWFGRAGVFDAGTDVINFIVLLGLSSLIIKVVGWQALQRLPRIYWQLLTAGIIMYAASFFFLIGLSSSLLYQPSRYTRSTLFLVMLFFVGLNWSAFLKKAPRWFRQRAPLIIFFVVSLALALGALYLILPDPFLAQALLWFVGLISGGLTVVLGASGLYWLVSGNWRLRGLSRFVIPAIIGLMMILAATFYIRTLGIRTIDPSPAERDIYEFVSTLPKDAVLAGQPIVMSGIPLFSQRSVLFRDLHPNVNPNVSPLILDYFDAQYAESPESVLDFCQRYGLSYLVIDTTEFTPAYLARENFFYQPWNDKIIETIAGRSNFALLRLHPVFSSGPFEVIKCDAEMLSQFSSSN